MPACSAIGCTNRKGVKTPGVSFHRFPKDKTRRQAWIIAVRRKNWTPSSTAVLCSEHFSEDMMDRTSLSLVRVRDHAIPNIFKDYSSNLVKLCEINFKKNDFETKSSAYDPKAEKTKTDSLHIRPLKKDVVSLLPANSSSAPTRESPLEKRMRLETEQHELALNKSLTNVPDENSQQASTIKVTSSSPTLRPFENEEEETKERIRMSKKRKKSVGGSISSKEFFDTSSPNSVQSFESFFGHYLNESHDRNNVSYSPDRLLEVQKEKPLWEDRISLSGNTSRNNPEDNITEKVQMTHVESESDDSNAELPSSEEEENAVIKPEGSFDRTLYTNPLNIDQKDKIFGNFISCELNGLRGNPELYMKTKQSILKVLAEAHFEQMSSGNKLTSKDSTNFSSVVL